MMMVVRLAISSCRALWMASSTVTSMALVASSNTSTLGLASSVRAMAMRWRWPPDKV